MRVRDDRLPEMLHWEFYDSLSSPSVGGGGGCALTQQQRCEVSSLFLLLRHTRKHTDMNSPYAPASPSGV